MAKQKEVVVPGYTRDGKRVKGFTRKYISSSRKRKVIKTLYRLDTIIDPKTGRIYGTKRVKLKNQKV